MKRRFRSFSFRGSARVEYTLSLAFAEVVFFTGRSWVMPLAQWGGAGSGEWIGMVSEPMHSLICGVIAVMIIVPLVFGVITVTRKF